MGSFQGCLDLIELVEKTMSRIVSTALISIWAAWMLPLPKLNVHNLCTLVAWLGKTTVTILLAPFGKGLGSCLGNTRTDTHTHTPTHTHTHTHVLLLDTLHTSGACASGWWEFGWSTCVPDKSPKLCTDE